jgi:hypothetical protein
MDRGAWGGHLGREQRRRASNQLIIPYLAMWPSQPARAPSTCFVRSVLPARAQPAGPRARVTLGRRSARGWAARAARARSIIGWRSPALDAGLRHPMMVLLVWHGVPAWLVERLNAGRSALHGRLVRGTGPAVQVLETAASPTGAGAVRHCALRHCVEPLRVSRVQAQPSALCVAQPQAGSSSPEAGARRQRCVRWLQLAWCSQCSNASAQCRAGVQCRMLLCDASAVQLLRRADSGSVRNRTGQVPHWAWLLPQPARH